MHERYSGSLRVDGVFGHIRNNDSIITAAKQTTSAHQCSHSNVISVGETMEQILLQTLLLKDV